MNPFRYGGVVTGDYFYNRTHDIQHIKDHLRSGHHLILYAPRRYGKTSLMVRVLKELEKENYNTVYLDFFNVFSLEKFLELYSAKFLSQKIPTLEGVLKRFKEVVKGITPSVTLDEMGKPQFQLSFNQTVPLEKTFQGVVDLPEKGFKNKRWIVVFDEFQEINHLNGDNFEKQLRACIQFHKNVSYVFMGSKSHLLMNMFRDPSRAFYNIGKFLQVDKIPEEETVRHLTTRFHQSGIQLTPEVAGYLLQVADNIPYYCQFIASEVWQRAITDRTVITRSDVDFAVDRVLAEQGDFYLELFDRLSTYQKKLLIALTQSGDRVFSKDYMLRHGLSTTSSTQRALERLMEMGIVERSSGTSYPFSDPFFKRHIALRFNA